MPAPVSSPFLENQPQNSDQDHDRVDGQEGLEQALSFSPDRVLEVLKGFAEFLKRSLRGLHAPDPTPKLASKGAKLLHQSFQLSEFKTLGTVDEPGTFEALAAVFGNVDHGGDRIVKGAFKRSLNEWAAKGRSVPVLWSHDAETVPIGVLTHAVENNEGLRVKAKLFVDDNPQARAVYGAMKGGALQEFSFGYGVREKGDVIEQGRQIRVLKDLDLAEVSPVFRGMNPATRLMGVKTAQIDLKSLGIDDLKTLGEEIASEIEQRSTDALEAAPIPPAPDPTPDSTENLLPETVTATQEPEDNPTPNPTDTLVLGEEAAARIRALQVSRPLHLE